MKAAPDYRPIRPSRWLQHPALKIAALYALFGGLWIVFSDAILLWMLRGIADPQIITRLQTIKGWFFIAATAWLLYLLIQRSMKAIQHSEKAVRQSEEWLQAILDNTTAVIYAKDTQGRFLLVNHQLETLFHRDKSTILGKTDHEILPQEIADNFRSNDLQVLQSKSAQEYEEVSLQDNEIHTYISLKFPLLDSEGEPYAVCGISTDITKLKKAELAHQEVNQHIADILAGITDAFVALDKNWRYTYVNEKAGQLLGRLPEYLIGKNIWEEFPEGIGQPFYHVYHKAIEEQIPIQFEDYYVPWERWFDNRVYPTKDGISIFFNDISDRKQVEIKLQESEEKFHNLAETTSAGIFIYQNDRLVYVNSAGEKLSGYSREELLTQKFGDIAHPEFRESVIERGLAHQQVKAGSANYECKMIAKDGQEKWMDLTMGTVVIGGQNAGLCTVYDITEHKHAEAEILRLNAELEQRVIERTAQLAYANKELEAFSYSISHDLRAPLRAISGFSQIICRRHSDNLNEEGRHYMDNIVQASAYMARLIDDLLNYARLGRKALNIQPVELSGLLTQIKQNLASQIAETGAELIIEPDLPTVPGDWSLLSQIFGNLINNALVYHKLGVPPRIRVSCRTEPRHFILSVADNGIGISPEHHQKIFNVFQRLHTDESYPGTGIGLALVRKSAEMLQAKVRLESQPNRGSTFYIDLPILPLSFK
ncbi:MAG: PAS domain S-box protein [Gammaproteobacteria bacterium]